MRTYRVLAASLCAFVVSCGLESHEQRGDAAYRRACENRGAAEETGVEKAAYTMYQMAMKAHPDKIKPRMHTRFLELSLIRAKMVPRRRDCLFGCDSTVQNRY
ncbi:MAG: hypothetical protein MZV70_77370 [Desulfobacterales bacterium]|nr:hypothetical protein [Desulfobacterales bacterium]